MKKQMAAGKPVSEDRQKSIENSLQEYEDLLYTKKAKNIKKNNGQIPDDPYHKNWRAGIPLSEMINSMDTSSSDLREIYHSFSDWHHWGCATIASKMKRDGTKVLFTPYRPSDVSSSFALGFSCLFHTLSWTDKHLELGIQEQTSSLVNEYVSWHEENGLV